MFKLETNVTAEYDMVQSSFLSVGQRGGHRQDLVITEGVTDCQRLLLLQTAKLSVCYRADRNRKMCSGKRDLCCKTLSSVEMITSLPLRSLAELQGFMQVCQDTSFADCTACETVPRCAVLWAGLTLCFTLNGLRLGALCFRPGQLSQRTLVYL